MIPSDKLPKGSNMNVGETGIPLENDEAKTLAENLYNKNIELLTKNKTLSLLSKLYEISILTLKPQELALRAGQMVQADLTFELVGIMILEPELDALVPLAFAKSERVKTTMGRLDVQLEGQAITAVTSREFFKDVVSSGTENRTSDLHEVWGDLVDPEKIQKIVVEDHIKATLLYPLKIESKILGVMMLALNRDYEALSLIEKESIKSFVNVIALALEKAYLYQKLEDANAQLRELDRQKDSVLHMVTHQFRQPVTAIKWLAEDLLEDECLNLPQKDQIRTIQASNDKMKDQIEMILKAAEFTKGGKMVCELAPIDLNEFFKNIVSENAIAAKERKVKLNATIPPRLPTVILDRTLTTWAIDNLVNNAIKYTAQKLSDGGGTVDLTVELKDQVLHCTVKDNGIGIPEDARDRLFKELARAKNAKGEGTGLGLFVAKGGIESQGGKIRYESKEGFGTTFFVELPLQIAMEEDFGKQKELAKEKQIPFEGKK